MTVITISRQFGSGGDEIASRLCQIMEYSHFDKRLIARAAIEAGLSDQEIIDFSEENYRVKNFLDRLFRRQDSLAKARYWRETSDGVRVMEETTLTEVHALTLVRKAVEMAYQSGNTLIMGRGGQMILHDHPDVLHVRIIAPIEDRIQRVKALMKQDKNEAPASIDPRRLAQDLITERDTASADYLRSFYNVDWSDPTLYHLIINTGMMSVDTATSYIVEMLNCAFDVKTEKLTGTLS